MANADARREPPVVLVVEDEPLVRMIMVDALADAGFEVIQASDAHEALRLFEDKPEVAIVLTDIDMPGGLDGLELRDRLQARAPHVPVVVTSGRGKAGRDRTVETRFLSKPFTVDELVTVIVSCLPADDDA